MQIQMPEPDLEQVIREKEIRAAQLQDKLNVLQTSSDVEISYTINLTQAEQINYAKLGIYHLFRDLNGYNKDYK